MGNILYLQQLCLTKKPSHAEEGVLFERLKQCLLYSIDRVPSYVSERT
jgi:hypothetical protein